MASNTIKGLTIEIGGDTTKLGKAVKDMETQAKAASKELTDINTALKLVPNSEELLLQKQKALAKEIDATSGKLDVLKEAEAQVQKQFEEGKVSEEQVQALQREIILTTNSLEGYQKAAEEVAAALKDAGNASEIASDGAYKIDTAASGAEDAEKGLTEKLKDQKEELSKLKEKYVDTAAQYGKNSDEAKKLEKQIEDLSGEVVKNEKAVKEASDAADKADKSLKDMGDAADQAGNGMSSAAVAVGTFIGNLALDVLKEAVSTLKELTEAAVEAVKETAEYGDQVDKASQKIGISAEAYQEWSAVMEHSGTSVDILQTGMKSMRTAMESLSEATGEATIDNEKLLKAQTAYSNKLLDAEKAQIAYDEAIEKYGEGSTQAEKAAINLQKAENNAALAQEQLNAEAGGMAPQMSKAAAAMASLGVSATDTEGNLRDEEEVFSETITALQGIENETERAYMAQIIFGKSATEMGALLATSAEETEEMKKRVHELGGVMSDEAVKDAAAFQDSLQDLQTAADGIKREFAAKIIPGAKAVMDQLTDVLSGGEIDQDALVKNVEQIVDQIDDILADVVAKANELAPVVEKVAQKLIQIGIGLGGTLLTGIIDGIISALPLVITAVFDVADGAAEVIGESMPALLEKLSENLVKIADTLATRVPQLVDKLGNALIKSIPAIAEAGYTLFMGLVQAIPRLVEALAPVVSQLVVSLVEMLVSNAPEYQEGVYTMFLTTLDALEQLIEVLVPLIPELVTTLIDLLLDNSDDLKKGAEQMFYTLIVAFGKISVKLLEVVAALIVNVINGIRKSFPKITELTDKIVDLILSPLTNLKQEMIDSGHNIIAGLIQGIEDYAKNLFTSGTKLANTLLEKITKPFEINSPSKKMAWVGEMIDEGLAEGIEDSSDEPEKQMNSMVSKLEDDASAEDVEFKVKAKLIEDKNAESDMLERLQAIASRMTLETAPLPQQIESQGGATGADSVTYYTDPALYERLDALLAAVRDGKVIAIDGDKLVGATISTIDQELGVRQSISERGELYDD